MAKYKFDKKQLEELSNSKKEKLIEAIKNYIKVQKEFKKKTPLYENIDFMNAYDILYGFSERGLTTVDKICYYVVFENNRKIGKKKIKDLLNEINEYKVSGNEDCELVFASKMLHTINNKKIIIDNKVLHNLTGYEKKDLNTKKNFKKYTNKDQGENKIKNECIIYNKYCKDFNNLKKEYGKKMAKMFDKFCQSHFTDDEQEETKKIKKIKKIDFILWITDVN